ncbi:MAG: AMP-binding enzyme [Chthoniobacterales bacterium]
MAGKRLGPAEVESILVAHVAVTEAAAVGVPDPIKHEALVCFCVLRTEVLGGENLARELKKIMDGNRQGAGAARFSLCRRSSKESKCKTDSALGVRGISRRRSGRHFRA